MRYFSVWGCLAWRFSHHENCSSLGRKFGPREFNARVPPHSFDYSGVWPELLRLRGLAASNRQKICRLIFREQKHSAIVWSEIRIGQWAGEKILFLARQTF